MLFPITHGEVEKNKWAEESSGLTLNEPSSPDGIVQPDLVSPQQAQTLERLPLRRDYLTTVKKEKM